MVNNFILFSDHVWYLVDDFNQAKEFFKVQKWKENVLNNLQCNKYAFFITSTNSVYMDERMIK